MSELKPCAECGCRIVEPREDDGGHGVWCLGCMHAVSGMTAEDAASAWNTEPRTSPTKTLRDEFAMAALTGLMAIEDDAEGSYYSYSPEGVARMAYEVADAMMTEREKADDGA